MKLQTHLFIFFTFNLLVSFYYPLLAYSRSRYNLCPPPPLRTQSFPYTRCNHITPNLYLQLHHALDTPPVTHSSHYATPILQCPLITSFLFRTKTSGIFLYIVFNLLSLVSSTINISIRCLLGLSSHYRCVDTKFSQLYLYQIHLKIYNYDVAAILRPPICKNVTVIFRAQYIEMKGLPTGIVEGLKNTSQSIIA